MSARSRRRSATSWCDGQTSTAETATPTECLSLSGSNVQRRCFDSCSNQSWARRKRAQLTTLKLLNSAITHPGPDPPRPGRKGREAVAAEACHVDIEKYRGVVSGVDFPNTTLTGFSHAVKRVIPSWHKAIRFCRENKKNCVKLSITLNAVLSVEWTNSFLPKPNSANNLVSQTSFSPHPVLILYISFNIFQSQLLSCSYHSQHGFTVLTDHCRPTYKYLSFHTVDLLGVTKRCCEQWIITTQKCVAHAVKVRAAAAAAADVYWVVAIR